MRTTWLKKWKVWLAVAVVAIGMVCALLVGNTIAAANDRKAAIEDYVSLHEELQAGAFSEGSITYTDSDGIVEVKRIHNGDSFTTGELSNVIEDQTTADMLAFEIGGPVIIYDYLADGHLFGFQVGYPDDISRAQDHDNALVAQRAQAAITAADAFAETNKDTILKSRCEEIAAWKDELNKVLTIAEAHYEYDGDDIWIVAKQKAGYGIRQGRTEEQYKSVVKAWEKIAEWDTRLLRQPVGYRFYTSDGNLDLEVRSEVADYYASPRPTEGESEAF